MAWIKKGNQEYCYGSVRRGKTVKRIYLGNRHMAWGASRFIAIRRELRLEAREATRQGWQANLDGVSGLEALCDLTDGLLGATLLQAGYRRHDRGEWRKKRNPKEGTKRHGNRA